jgi:hypothetical protein
MLNGLPESPLANIHFQNIAITARSGIQKQYADGILLENVAITLNKQEKK